MRVTHKVTDHHLHHKQQWRAAMTTHWVHQLPTVDVDKHIIIFPKTWANHYTQSASWFLLPFRKQWEDSDVMLASTQETLLIKKVNSTLIQAATYIHESYYANKNNQWWTKAGVHSINIEKDRESYLQGHDLSCWTIPSCKLWQKCSTHLSTAGYMSHSHTTFLCFMLCNQ